MTFSPSLRGRSKKSSRPLAAGVVDRPLARCSQPLTMPALTSEIRDMPFLRSQCPSRPACVTSHATYIRGASRQLWLICMHREAWSMRCQRCILPSAIAHGGEGDYRRQYHTYTGFIVQLSSMAVHQCSRTSNGDRSGGRRKSSFATRNASRTSCSPVAWQEGVYVHTASTFAAKFD